MANLYFEATVNIDQVRRELREMEQRMKMTAASATASGQEIDRVFKRIGQAAAGYLSLTAAKGFVDQLIQVRGEFQQLDIALETMLGNKQKSDKLMGEVVQLAAKTPFSLTELGRGAKQLIAFKEPADKVADTLRRIGDVAAGVSVPVGDLISAYGKVSAKGKMQAEELNQFAERGVPIISELAKVIGTTDDKIYKMAEDGKIGFKELQQAIMNMTNEGGQFANMMEKQAGSLTGLVSNLGDAWDRMLNDIGTSNQGVLASGIKGLTSLVDNYEEVLKVLGLIVGTYGAYKAAIVAVSMAQKAEQVLSMLSAWTGLTKSINSAKNAQIAFNTASRLNPMGLAASAIAALVGGLLLYSSASKKAASASEEVGRAVMAETTKMDALFSVAKNTTVSTEARKSAIDEINKAYAPYLDNMLTEKSTLEEIEKAQRNATNALIADVGVKKSKDKLTEALSKFSEDQDKILSGFLSDLVDVSGPGVQSAFMSELNKMVDYANQFGLMGANGYSLAYREFYDTFAKQVAQSKGFMEYGQQDIAVMVQNIADKRKVLDGETKKIQGLIDAYSALTAGNKNGNGGGGGNNVNFDLKEYEKTLNDQKKAYESYWNARIQMGEEYANKEFANLLKSGKDYQDYLTKQYFKIGNTDAQKAILDAASSANVKIGNPLALDEFVKVLEDAKTAYQNYESEVKIFGQNAADQRYQTLLSEGATYKEYLDNKVKQTIWAEDEIVSILKKRADERIPEVEARKRVDKTTGKELNANAPDANKLADMSWSIKQYTNDIKELFANIDGLSKAALKSRLGDIDAMMSKLDKSSTAYVELAKQRGVVDKAISDKDNKALSDIGDTANLLSSAGDEFSRKMGEMVSSISDMASVLTDSSASGMQKVSGIVSAAIVAGKQLQEIGRDSWYEGVNAQMALNEGIAAQLTIEREILRIRQERRDLEMNSNAFLDPSFMDEYQNTLNKMGDAEKSLNDNISALMDNAVFSSKGKAKRRLAGTKSGTYSFTLEDIIRANYPEVAGIGGIGGIINPAGNVLDALKDGDAKRAIGALLDPAGVFGGYADSKANKNAFKNLSKAFDDTLKAMGKTSADIANMSTQEWVEFYSLMEVSGKITDKGTKEMVANAKAAAEEYAAAKEELRQIISDVAGDLGSKLADSLVSAFESGEDAALAFQDTVNDVLNSMFMQQLTDRMFKPYYDKLQAEMDASMDGGDMDWSDDIQRFFSNITPAIGTASDAMAAYDEQMEALGFKGFNNQNLNESNSLSGAVKGVSEETASIISGQMNAIRINQAESLKMMNLSIAHMAEVAANTRYNRHLEEIRDILKSQSTSDPLRAKGF